MHLTVDQFAQRGPYIIRQKLTYADMVMEVGKTVPDIGVILIMVVDSMCFMMTNCAKTTWKA